MILEDKYFDDSVDYPSISGEILPTGILYCYVSSTFINGFLNYSKPLKAFLMHRYEENPRTNKLAAEKFNSSNDHHSNLRTIRDDILLLSKNDAGEYWYFWLDNDVSDVLLEGL